MEFGTADERICGVHLSWSGLLHSIRFFLVSPIHMILPYSGIISHYVHAPHAHGLLICCWTFGSFSTVQTAAMSMTRRASVGYDVESFGHVPRSGRAGAMVILLLACRGFSTLIFIMAVPVILPGKE